MKYGIIMLAAALLSVTFTYEAEAQLLNRLKKKAREAAEKKAEEKLTEEIQKASEQMVERSWNSIFGDLSADSTSGEPWPFQMSSDVTTEDTYRFDTSVTMEIATVRQDGTADPPALMELYFNKNEAYTGTKFRSEEINRDKDEGAVFLIYDLKNSAMLMLMESDNRKFSMAYDWAQASLLSEDSETGESVAWDEVESWNGYTKIGSKSILGYNCDGYRSESDTETIELWVSRDADFGTYHLFKANNQSKNLKGSVPEEYPEGMIMEMISEQLDSGQTTTMKAVDISDKVGISYAMKDYPAMNFGSYSSKN